MKCVLINPVNREVYGKSDKLSAIVPPIGLAYIAAVLLKSSYDVRILDVNAENLGDEEIERRIRKEDPEVVGITSLTPVIYKALNIANIVKDVNEEIKVVMGGAHPTVLFQEVLKNPNVDFVVRGEGEYTFLDLLNHLRTGQDIKNAKGISYRLNNEIISTPQRTLITNLDELPFPAYHLLPMDKYSSVQTKGKHIAHILTSRGCPYRCIFCNKNIFGYKYRTRSVGNIISEMEFLIEQYGIDEFHILDDVFTLNKKRVEKICEIINEKDLDIFWKCPNGVRVDNLNKDLLKKMNDSGCYSLSFGIESGSQEILDKLKKGITIEQIENAIKWSKEVGIFTIGFFTIGNIGDNKKTIQQTINFAKHSNLDIARFYIIVPYPGTEIRERIEKEGKILSNDWAEYGNTMGKVLFEHGELTKELMGKMFVKAHREFYMRPSYVLKKLIKIRNLNDIKVYTNALSTIVKMSRES